jgi:ribosomal-protein-alanine N-acetyltransferase
MLFPSMDALIDRAIEIRHRGPGDDAFIERLGREAFAVFDPKAGTSTRLLAEHPDAEALVAVRGRERLGFLVLVTRGYKSWIEAIAVLERARGLGVGTRLMQAAVRAARRRGVRRLSLTTAQANVEALELFLRCGFRIERRMPRFYAAGQDACVLSRSL